MTPLQEMKELKDKYEIVALKWMVKYPDTAHWTPGGYSAVAYAQGVHRGLEMAYEILEKEHWTDGGVKHEVNPDHFRYENPR